MTGKRVAVIILTVCLTAGAVLMMFPGWMKELFPAVDFDKTFVDFDELSMYNFPFYGSARQTQTHAAPPPAGETAPGEAEAQRLKYGVSNIVDNYVKYMQGQTSAPPDFGAEFERIVKQEGFVTALYSLLMVSLLTIPAYLVLRLLLFNTLYGISKKIIWVFKLVWNGLVAVCASVLTTFLTWFLYRSFLYELTFTIIFNWLKSLVSSTLALYSLGSAMTLLVGFLVVWLIRATVFRGSVFTSLLGALMRTILFTILIAIISVCIFEMTLQTIGFILAGLIVIGVIKTIFLPEK